MSGRRFARLPTAAKAPPDPDGCLLPIGIALTLIGWAGIRQADAALQRRIQDQARPAAQSIESLLARNALALRIAANGAGNLRGDARCEDVRRSLAIAPGVVQRFRARSGRRQGRCATGEIGATGSLPLARPAISGSASAPYRTSLRCASG